MANNLSNAELQDITFDPSEMLSMLRRLSKVLEQEVAMLNVMDLAGINNLYQEKIELIAIMEGYKTTLASKPEILSSIPARVLEELKNESAKFEVLVEEDNKQLDRAREVHKIIMKAVRSVLEKNMAMSTGYNKRGVVDIASKSISYTPSISINEKI